MISVEHLSTLKEGEHRDFLLEHEEAQIFSDTCFRDFLIESVGGTPEYFIALDVEGKIIGSLNCFKASRRGLGLLINSLPWYGSHGGCVVAKNRASEIRSALLNRYMQLLQEECPISSTLILSPCEENSVEDYRVIISPTVEDFRIGQISRLPSSQDKEGELLRTMHQKTRNLVRKSLKQDFEFVLDDSEAAWEFLCKTHCENMIAMGAIPKPRGHFEALRRQIPQEYRQLAVATSKGNRVAALLLLLFNRTVEYLTPVIQLGYRSAQPLSFLIWRCMLRTAEQGYWYWNWGGTWRSQESLYRFKSRWGATDYPYSYLISAKSDGIRTLAKHKTELSALFPYYYAFPYDRLK